MATAILVYVHNFIQESSVKHTPMLVHSHLALMVVPAPSQAMEPHTYVPVARDTLELTAKSLIHVVQVHALMGLHVRPMATATFVYVSSSTQVTNVRHI